jgi:hypothetical protein
MENGSKKNLWYDISKKDYLPIQHSSLEQGFDLVISGGSTPI